MIPVFALNPSCHRDRENALASLGCANELVKCLECSERAQKVNINAPMVGSGTCTFNGFRKVNINAPMAPEVRLYLER